jgi:Flp pilus assembly CpaE family ATPase
MDQNSLTLLLIEDTAEYAELVQHWVSSADTADAFCLNWTDTLAAGLNRLARGGVDVILLDLGLPDSNGVETFMKARAHAAGIPIIILSAADSEALALQMIRDGAADYLVKNTCNGSSLVRAVRYAVVRHRSQAAENGGGGRSTEGKIIGVIGAKGGVGATTVACHLAAELRSQTSRKVLLADLDVHAGLIPMIFGLEPKYSLRDVIQNIRHLDQTCWESMVTRGAGDLDILPSPSLLGDSELSADSIRQVLTLVLPFYDWIVLDLGRLNGLVMRLRDRLSEILIVTGTSIPALYETKRVADAFLKGGTDGERLRLVVNQRQGEQALSGSEWNQIFGIPVYARLLVDGEELDNACLQGRLPAESHPLRRQIGSLARKIAGLPEKRPRWGLPRLLSFRDRFRRTGEAGTEAPGESC